MQKRYATRSFLSKSIPNEIIGDILAMTIRTPSSFNTQPWACIVVENSNQKEKVAQAMLGHNSLKVRSAPLVAVFLADLQPTKRIPRMIEEERKAGSSEEQISQLPAKVGLFGGEGYVAELLKKSVMSVLSPLQPTPSLTGVEAWAFKHAALAAQTYMLAATSYGLGTAPMEGYDGRRIKAVLDVPDRYEVCLTIATGYTDESNLPKKRSWRFTPEEMVFLNRFGDSVPGVHSL